SACGNGSDNGNGSDGGNGSGGGNTAEESIKVGEVMVTFSTSNDLMKKYPHFKLGLYDVVAHVRDGGELHRVSLFNVEPQQVHDYSQTVALELTDLEKDSHLYQGFMRLPVGTVETVEVHIGGSRTSVKIDGDKPILTDAFFAAYTGAESRLQSRVFPADVKTASNITIKESELTVLNINIDMNLTAGMDPMYHADPRQTYALFTPSIKVEDKTVDSLNLSIKQLDLINITDKDLVMGDAESTPFNAAYTLSATDKLWMNGSSVTALGDATNATEGLYMIDMMGTFKNTGSDYTFDIAKAHLAAVSENSTNVIYHGMATVEGTTLSINGYMQALDTSLTAVEGSAPFNGEVSGDAPAGISTGDMVTVWSDGTTPSLVMTHAAMMGMHDSVMRLAQSTAYTGPDYLGVNSMADSSVMTLPNAESVDCKDVVMNKDGSDCSGTFTSIDFTNAATGMYTLHATRMATATANGSQTDLALLADEVTHYATAAEFLDALKARAGEGYKLASLQVAGAVSGDAFAVSSMAKAIIMQPSDIFDNQDNAFVTGLESEGAVLAGKKTKAALIAGGAIVGGVAISALLGHVIDRLVSFNKVKNLAIKVAEGTDGNFIKYFDKDNVERRMSITPTADGVVVSGVKVLEDGSVWANFSKDGKAVNIDGESITNPDPGTKILDFDGKVAEGMSGKFTSNLYAASYNNNANIPVFFLDGQEQALYVQNSSDKTFNPVDLSTWESEVEDIIGPLPKNSTGNKRTVWKNGSERILIDGNGNFDMYEVDEKGDRKAADRVFFMAKKGASDEDLQTALNTQNSGEGNPATTEKHLAKIQADLAGSLQVRFADVNTPSMADTFTSKVVVGSGDYTKAIAHKNKAEFVTDPNDSSKNLVKLTLGGTEVFVRQLSYQPVVEGNDTQDNVLIDLSDAEKGGIRIQGNDIFVHKKDDPEGQEFLLASLDKDNPGTLKGGSDKINNIVFFDGDNSQNTKIVNAMEAESSRVNTLASIIKSQKTPAKLKLAEVIKLVPDNKYLAVRTSWAGRVERLKNFSASLSANIKSAWEKVKSKLGRK
ncbi:MAG: hypothetical protein OXE99_06955, partial [Cellvibrionales bacterium]|nr:hypothetical protein [Cellvibrionales bacterium]